MNKFTYILRVIDAYVLKKHSHLDFWHGKLEGEVNDLGTRYEVQGTSKKNTGDRYEVLGTSKKNVGDRCEVQKKTGARCKVQGTGQNKEKENELGTRNSELGTVGGWEFWQTFDYKAEYPGPFDENGVIILDYRGVVGRQKYHIAISQYGLACYNRWKRTNDKVWYDRFMAQVKWHEDNLKANEKGIYLWYANFDWEYHGIHKAPWPSGLAQGNGLSLLVRAYAETKEQKYFDMCEKVFKSMITEVKDGGVMVKETKSCRVTELQSYRVKELQENTEEGKGLRVKEENDERSKIKGNLATLKPCNSETVKPCNSETREEELQNEKVKGLQRNKVTEVIGGWEYWIEEAIVEPPTHILNGFMWAVMGIYDYYLLTRREDVKMWFDRFIKTIADNLHTFDTGYWSLYEHSHTKIPMVASTFYHGLHLVQLEILYNITKNEKFEKYLIKWKKYQKNIFKKAWAVAVKVVFKAGYF